MLTMLTKDMSYKQVTIVRSLLFSLVLLIAMHNGLVDKWVLNTYLILFLLRVIFNYDLEMIKDKWFPFISLMFIIYIDEGFVVDGEEYDMDEIFEWNLDDITSAEYTKKTSFPYITCFIGVNIISMLLTVYPKTIILYTLLAYINTKMSFTIYSILIVGSLIAYLVHLTMDKRNKKQKEKLKNNLDV